MGDARDADVAASRIAARVPHGSGGRPASAVDSSARERSGAHTALATPRRARRSPPRDDAPRPPRPASGPRWHATRRHERHAACASPEQRTHARARETPPPRRRDILLSITSRLFAPLAPGLVFPSRAAALTVFLRTQPRTCIPLIDPIPGIVFTRRFRRAAPQVTHTPPFDVPGQTP